MLRPRQISENEGDCIWRPSVDYQIFGLLEHNFSNQLRTPIIVCDKRSFRQTTAIIYPLFQLERRGHRFRDCVVNFITYTPKTITEFKPPGNLIIANVCNEVGIWSGTNSKLIADEWPTARSAYLNWYRNRINNDFSAGAVQFVRSTNNLTNRRVRIANMIAQSEYYRPIRYRSFEQCLLKVARKALRFGAPVHLAKPARHQTDSWRDLEDVINRILCSSGVSVFVFDPCLNLKPSTFC